MKVIKAAKINFQVENEKQENILVEFKNEYLKRLSDKENNGEIHLDKDKMKSLFNLLEKDFEEIDQKARKLCLDELLRSSIKDETLSPDEYDNIISIAKRMNVNLSFDTATSVYLEKLKKYWKIENENLEIKSVDILLQGGEVCYFKNTCRWFEHRSITESYSYSGIGGSFKIAKGIRYRVGNIKLQRITTDKLVEIDQGQLFITNKRIIFMGLKKNINIKYKNILSVIPYIDGIEIQKDSGKSPTLIFDDADIAARILARLNDTEN